MQISYLFRDGIGAAELRQTGSKKMHVLQLDVTNQEDWSKVKQYIEKNIPSTVNGNIFWQTLRHLQIPSKQRLELKWSLTSLFPSRSGVLVEF